MKTPMPAPEVTVRIPEVRLQLQDIAYMRSLGSEGVHCTIHENSRHRLSLLGLIHQIDTPAPKERVTEVAAEMKTFATEARLAFKAKKWQALERAAYNLGRSGRRLEPTKQWTLTDAGRKLLSSGEIKVKMMKTGCGK